MSPSKQERLEYFANLARRFQLCFETKDFAQAIELTAMVTELFADNQGDLEDPLPEQAEVFDSVATVLSASGEYGEAESFHQRAMVLRVAVFGEEHPAVAHSLETLASFYERTGRSSESQQLASKAKGLLRRRLDQLGGLIQELVARGQYQAAIPPAREACQLVGHLEGPSSPDYAQWLNNLAFLYKQLAFDHEHPELLHEAKRLYQQAVEIYRQSTREESPDLAVFINNLGELYRVLGELSLAEAHFQEALNIWRKTTGEDSPAVAGALNNLALVLDAKGNHDAAERLILQALDIRRERFGEEHPYVAQSLNNLAKVHESLGRHEEAETCYLRAHHILRATVGSHHPDAVRTLNNLQEFYQRQSNPLARERIMEYAVDAFGYPSDEHRRSARRSRGDRQPYFVAAGVRIPSAA